jgi:hypothetical protein
MSESLLKPAEMPYLEQKWPLSNTIEIMYALTGLIYSSMPFKYLL